MNATEALEKRIDELCAENERLRQASEYEKMEAFVRLLAKIEALKLLCRDMLTCINHACYCEFCPMFVSEDMNERRCIADIMARMHELGIR